MYNKDGYTFGRAGLKRGADKVTTSKIIRAEVNVPLELAYRDAEPVQGQYGDQMKYTLVDGRIFYADLAVANKVQALGIGPGQPFTLLKRKDGRSYVWQIMPSAGAATPAPVQQSHPQAHGNGVVGSYVQNSRNGHGELALPAPGGNGHGIIPPADRPSAAGPDCSIGNGASARPDTNVFEHSGLAAMLREHSQMLMHLYSQLVPWAADEFHGVVKPDDVRAIMTTAYINITKGGPMR
jgi:hypothetical protein